MRWHRLNEKRRQHRTQKHLPRHKKSPFDTSRRICANPKLLPSLALNAASIDVSYRGDNGWEDIESTKSDGDTDDRRNTHLVTKNRLSTRAAGSTPIPSYCLHWHRMPHRLMYHTGATMGEKTSNQQNVTATGDRRKTHLVSKNRFSTRAAGSAPIPSYCLHWHRMPHWLMHHTGATMG